MKQEIKPNLTSLHIAVKQCPYPIYVNVPVIKSLCSPFNSELPVYEFPSIKTIDIREYVDDLFKQLNTEVDKLQSDYKKLQVEFNDYKKKNQEFEMYNKWKRENWR
jgi:hypothetical protein